MARNLLGVYEKSMPQTLPFAEKQMVKIKKRLTPNHALREIYANKFQRYKAISGALGGMW